LAVIAVKESQMLINLKNILLQQKSLLAPQANAQEQQRKGQDVEIGQLIPVDDVIYTNYF
jgi:hypothetical protein